jgi:hypothetical protein
METRDPQFGESFMHGHVQILLEEDRKNRHYVTGDGNAFNSDHAGGHASSWDLAHNSWEEVLRIALTTREYHFIENISRFRSASR